MGLTMSPPAIGIIGALSVMLILLVVCLGDAVRRIYRLNITLREQKDQYETRARASKATLEMYAKKLRAAEERLKPKAPTKRISKPKAVKRSVWDRIKKPDV